MLTECVGAVVVVVLVAPFLLLLLLVLSSSSGGGPPPLACRARGCRSRSFARGVRRVLVWGSRSSTVERRCRDVVAVYGRERHAATTLTTIVMTLTTVVWRRRRRRWWQVPARPRGGQLRLALLAARGRARVEDSRDGGDARRRDAEARGGRGSREGLHGLDRGAAEGDGHALDLQDAGASRRPRPRPRTRRRCASLLGVVCVSSSSSVRRCASSLRVIVSSSARRCASSLPVVVSSSFTTPAPVVSGASLSLFLSLATPVQRRWWVFCRLRVHTVGNAAV